MRSFVPRLDILPTAQRLLWPELECVPSRFVLYGGTAIALRLGHRQSVDFDLFSSESFEVEDLIQELPFLRGSRRTQSQRNTLSVELDRGGVVQLSFFGGLTMGRVEDPETAGNHSLLVASMLDLAGMKAAVVQQRALRKDYLDTAAMLQAGLPLERALGAARALYGEPFNPMITLRALSHFGDGDLPRLPEDVKEFLAQRASQVRAIPVIARLSDQIALDRGHPPSHHAMA